jgi:hypothetical protein
VTIHRGEKEQILGDVEASGEVGHGGTVRQLEGRGVSLGTIGQVALQGGEELYLDPHGQGSAS